MTGRPVKSPLVGGASYPLRHRLFRLLWQVVWALFGRWSPVPFHGWRRLLLRCFGARIDATARVYPSARIWYPPNLAMGPHACLGGGVMCYCMDKITLGPGALVSQRAHLCGGSHDVDGADFGLVTAPISIGAGAWIAAEAFVGPGVSIGDHAVLGARGVAFGNLAPWTIYAGNPARPIRRREDGVRP